MANLGLDMPHNDKNASLCMRLKTRQMLLLVALGNERNIHRASEVLKMTQPAASKQLKDLEDTLGVMLFDRHARGMTPTGYGETMIRHARAVLTSLAQAQDDIDALKCGLSGKVNVGIIMSPAVTTIPAAIVRVKRQAPLLCINVQMEASDVLLDRLQNGDLDFALARVTAREDRSNLQFEELAQEPVRVVARLGHPLLGQARVSMDDIAQFGWVLPSNGSILRQRFDMAFRRRGVQPPANVVETASTLVVTSILEQTDFLHAMPFDVADYCARFNMLRIVPVDLGCTMDSFGIITRSGHALSPGATILMAAIRDIANTRYPVETGRRSSKTTYPVLAEVLA
jgi:DNA-binding transcriptional LysR family regulator